MSGLKASLKTSKSRALLVIDNTPIRKKAVQNAQKWLKKIENIEISAQKFYQTDLKLYTDWYNLTFNPLMEKISDVEATFFEKAEFYNLILFVADEGNISLPKAFLILKREQEDYEKGDLAVRDKIDQIRHERKKALDKSVKEQIEGKNKRDNKDQQCNCEICRRKRGNFEDDLFDDEINFEDEDPEEDERLVAYYENLSDKKIAKIMRESMEGNLFFMEAMMTLVAVSRMDILKRIWGLTPKKMKDQINAELRQNVGLTFDRILQEAEKKSTSGKEFQSEKPIDKGHHQSTPQSEDAKLQSKSLFRKIARKIHPDHLNAHDFENLKTWFDVIWKKVTDAHSRHDYLQLQALHQKIMVVLKDFEGLTISDLENAAQSFEIEYKNIVIEIEDIKNNPAWNFSKLKNYSKLEKKLSKPFLFRLEDINYQLSSLQEQLKEIELIACRMKPNQQSPKLSKKRKKLKTQNTSQTSFF